MWLAAQQQYARLLLLHIMWWRNEIVNKTRHQTFLLRCWHQWEIRETKTTPHDLGFGQNLYPSEPTMNLQTFNWKKLKQHPTTPPRQPRRKCVHHPSSCAHGFCIRSFAEQRVTSDTGHAHQRNRPCVPKRQTECDSWARWFTQTQHYPITRAQTMRWIISIFDESCNMLPRNRSLSASSMTKIITMNWHNNTRPISATKSPTLPQPSNAQIGNLATTHQDCVLIPQNCEDTLLRQNVANWNYHTNHTTNFNWIFHVNCTRITKWNITTRSRSSAKSPTASTTHESVEVPLLNFEMAHIMRLRNDNIMLQRITIPPQHRENGSSDMSTIRLPTHTVSALVHSQMWPTTLHTLVTIAHHTTFRWHCDPSCGVGKFQLWTT